MWQFSRGSQHSLDPLTLDISNPGPILDRLPDSKRLKARLQFWREGSFPGTILNYRESELRRTSNEHIIALAALHAEAGLLTTAASLVDRAISRDAEILDKIRYMGLTASVAPARPNIHERYSYELAAAARYRAQLGSFERLITQNRSSIAIVGNSPCERGNGRGPEIDEKSVVIRFNNYSTKKPYNVDYGEKTDVWCLGANYKNVWRRDANAHRLRILAKPVYWREINSQDIIITSHQFGRTLEDYPSDLYYALRIALGARPSAGLAVAFWISSILGSLDDVLLAGFSLTDQFEGTKHYFPSPQRRKPPPHNWQKERLIFDKLLSGAFITDRA